MKVFIPGKVNYVLILLFVLAGTLIRFYWGTCTHAWLGTPDQLAWGLGIDEMLEAGEFSYKKLITYPHEGGSFGVGVFSMVFRAWPIFPSLSWASLVLDSITRFLQIGIAWKLLGNRTGLAFGIGTIFAVPLMIPWGTVNFCQHATASVFPFLFVYINATVTQPIRRSLLAGALTGFGIWFSYTNLILIPAYLFWVLILKTGNIPKFKQLAVFSAITLLFVLPHLLLRLIPSNGFELNPYALTSIRGVEWNLFSIQNLKSFGYFWYKPLPSSLFLSSVEYVSSSAIRWIAFGFITAGLLLAFRNTANRSPLKISLMVILFFVISYVFSPFYADSIQNKSHVYYRHLTYIVPLIILWMISGFLNAGKFAGILIAAWLLVCLAGSTVFLRDCKPVTFTYRNAGWVLAAKYGNDTDQLMRISALSPGDQQPEVIRGFGWGLAARLLEGKSVRDSASIEVLDSLYTQFPPEAKVRVREGIEFAFSNGVTPVLDKNILLLLNERLQP